MDNLIKLFFRSFGMGLPFGIFFGIMFFTGRKYVGIKIKCIGFLCLILGTCLYPLCLTEYFAGVDIIDEYNSIWAIYTAGAIALSIFFTKKKFKI